MKRRIALAIILTTIGINAHAYRLSDYGHGPVLANATLPSEASKFDKEQFSYNNIVIKNRLDEEQKLANGPYADKALDAREDATNYSRTNCRILKRFTQEYSESNCDQIYQFYIDRDKLTIEYIRAESYKYLRK